MQIVKCCSGHSWSDVVKRHHKAMEHKIDLVGEDGTAACIVLWLGDNSFKAMLNAGEFQDRQRILQRRVATSRLIDVVEEPKASLDMTAANAVLLVTGKHSVDAGSAEEFFAAQALTDIPGAVGKVFLRASDKKALGGCYFFSDEQSMAAYAASELFSAAHADAPIADMKVERYVVATVAPPSPAA